MQKLLKTLFSRQFVVGFGLVLVAGIYLEICLVHNLWMILGILISILIFGVSAIGYFIKRERRGDHNET